MDFSLLYVRVNIRLFTIDLFNVFHYFYYSSNNFSCIVKVLYFMEIYLFIRNYNTFICNQKKAFPFCFGIKINYIYF